MDIDRSLQHAIELLLSPLEEPFQRYLDVCDDVHACDGSGNTLLHWAAALGNFTGTYALLKRGLEVDARNAHGATALIVAAALSPNVGAIGYLLVSYGASLNARVSGDRSLTVQSLLEARQLASVWTWLVDCKNNVYPEGDGGPVSFQGRRELPPTDSNMLSVLCSPTRLTQMRLRQGASLSHVKALPVPRAPPRRPQQLQRSLPTRAFKAPANPLLACVLPSDVVASLAKAQDTQLALIASQEETDRLQVEKDEIEAFLYLYTEVAAFSIGCDDGNESEERGGWGGSVQEFSKDWEASVANGASASIVAAADIIGGKNNDCDGTSSVDHVQAVLGERVDEHGRRYLLVRYEEPYAANGRSEAWHFANSIASDPVVRAYLERTYSVGALTDLTDVMTPSVMTLGNAGSPLESWEREQFEAQLRLLPRRVFHSQEEGLTSHSHSEPLSLASAAGQSLIPGNAAINTDAMWKGPQQQQLGSENRMNSNNDAVVMASPPSLSSASMVQAQSFPVIERAEPSWRFSPGLHRQSGSKPENNATKRSDSDMEAHQRFLSDGLRRTPGTRAERNSGPLQDRPPALFSLNRISNSSVNSSDTMASNSLAFSTAPTMAPTPYADRTADTPPVKTYNSYLTPREKADYNNFLYGAALRILKRQQRSPRQSNLQC